MSETDGALGPPLANALAPMPPAPRKIATTSDWSVVLSVCVDDTATFCAVGVVAAQISATPFCAFARTSKQPDAEMWSIDDLVEKSLCFRYYQDFTEIHVETIEG